MEENLCQKSIYSFPVFLKKKHMFSKHETKKIKCLLSCKVSFGVTMSVEINIGVDCNLAS